MPNGYLIVSGQIIGPGTDVFDIDVTGVDLSRINPFGLASGQLRGNPSAMPEGYVLLNGYILGPNVASVTPTSVSLISQV